MDIALGGIEGGCGEDKKEGDSVTLTRHIYDPQV